VGFGRSKEQRRLAKDIWLVNNRLLSMEKCFGDTLKNYLKRLEKHKKELEELKKKTRNLDDF
jgi:hypothetical protein